MNDEGQALLSFLRQEAERARSTSLDDERATAIDYYNGEPYGDEEEGRSQLRTRDVAEVIDQQVISVLRTMVSGDHVVEFDGEGDDGEDYGEQATEAVKYQFMRKQSGYRVLHDALKAGLLEKTGICKSWAAQEYDVQRFELSADELAMAPDMGLELLAAEPADETEAVWKVKARTAKPVQFKDMAVPNEEFLIAPDARELDGPEYKAHVSEKSLSDLIRMGFDAEMVREAYGDSPGSTVLRDARDATSFDVARSGDQRKVTLYEEYVRYDADGDGFDELLQVFRVGDKVLGIEEVDEQPFSGWTPFPMQHRFVGQSSADKCMDVQLTRSTMLRQAMDNLYLSNAPRMNIDVSLTTDETIDDALTVIPGGLIRSKGMNAVTPVAVPFVAGHAFEAMEMMTGEREARTGVTRHNQGLNPDTLNKTASGMAMLREAGDQVEEYIARNFAEQLVAPMFAKRYRMMRKFGQPFSMKVDGKRVEVDPRKWPEDIDIMINVGLGTGRKDQRLAYRAQLLDIQKEARAAGSILVDDERLYNNVRGLVKDAALGNPSDYFVNPEEVKQANGGKMPEKPDPQMAEAQAKAMIEAEKVKGEQEKAQADQELRRMQIEADLQAKREAAALDAQLAQAKADREWQLAQQKADREFYLAQEKLRMEREIAEAKAESDAQLPSNRPGGSLAE